DDAGERPVVRLDAQARAPDEEARLVERLSGVWIDLVDRRLVIEDTVGLEKAEQPRREAPDAKGGVLLARGERGLERRELHRLLTDARLRLAETTRQIVDARRQVGLGRNCFVGLRARGRSGGEHQREREQERRIRAAAAARHSGPAPD